jgi:hypothetical protein
VGRKATGTHREPAPRRLGFDDMDDDIPFGSFGQVCCIGWARQDEQPTTVYGTDEKFVLSEFARLLKNSVGANEAFNCTVIGHNVSAFDLRFLSQRFVVNGIRPPMMIARAAQAKPWESEKVFDTMVQWAGIGQKIGLDKLCMALSIPSPKAGMDGSMVWPMVQDGKIDEVARYCERDVQAVRAVWQRMTFRQTAVEQFEDVAA